MKHQSHGLTIAEMKQLREKQANGEDLDVIESNCPEIAKKYPQFKIHAHEKHLMHVVLEKRQFDQSTGKRLSKPRMQKYYVNDFNMMSKTVSKAGEKNRPQNAFGEFDVIDIIYDPRKKEGDTRTVKISKPLMSGEDKLLTEMNLEELRSKYEDVFGVPADEQDSEAQLLLLIQEEVNKP